LAQVQAALGDRYRVSRQLGAGGMATVFLAEDLKHQRNVAVKVLRPELSAAVGAGRFLSEIGIAAKLQHPHILPLFDSGQVGGLLYYVMPFVDGRSLRDRIANQGELPIDEALRIINEVGDALHAAHRYGIVHRDIKPENILLSDGHSVVADFGIAKALSVAGGERLTGTGIVVGTPAYMSPEQATGDSVDGRSDQYSLACTLYEMLTAQPPFTGPSAQAILARHSLEAVPSLRVVRPAIPAGVERAVHRAMAKRPVDRFGSVAEFLAALSTGRSGDRPGGSPARRRVMAVAAITAIVAAVSAGVWWGQQERSNPSRGRIGTVAVLPFTEATAQPDSAYLADAVTQDVIADLARIGSLKVMARSSGALLAGSGKPLAEAATTLGVDGVVGGSIARQGDSVRLAVEFHDGRGTAVWSKEYRGGLADLPSLQRQITVAVAEAIDAKLGRAERTRPEPSRAVDQRAYDAYLRGRFYLDQGAVEPARLMFERARELAPGWASSYVGLANYYTSLPFFSDVPPIDVLPKARAALVRAIELDETLAEAHATNAYVRAYYDWDWKAAEREFARALELRPNYADAYFSYARFLASRGRLDEAIGQIGRATELDPLSVGLQANTALLNYFAGRYDTALAQLRRILITDSTNTLVKWGIALVAEQQGRLGEAIAILEPISAVNLNRKSSLGHAYGVSGRVAEARGVLKALQGAADTSYVPSYFFAVVHLGLGEGDRALQYLERAYQERSTVLAYLRIDPRLAPLRTDPRFQALVTRLGGE
jgi:serine/threonine-protein kinase